MVICQVCSLTTHDHYLLIKAQFRDREYIDTPIDRYISCSTENITAYVWVDVAATFWIIFD